jgi:putative phosphonate metabolism protein
VIGAAAAPEARLAVYWAPDLDDPLHRDGSAWLGRDAETGAALPQPAVPGHDLHALTADPRGYGLHATLKAPFRLRVGWAEARAAAAALAARLRPFELSPLAVRDLDGFLALRETAPCPQLRALADACTEALDPCRAPPGEAELAKRRRAKLSPEQETNLVRWGYPHVFDAWRFHVTLTRRLTPAEKDAVLPAAEAHLREALRHRRRVSAICLFTQANPAAPFLVAERLRFGG